MANRPSRGVDSSAASATPSWAPAVGPEAYNVGRLGPAVVRVAPIGSPPTDAKSTFYLNAASENGISTAVETGRAEAVNPIALHTRVKALLEGELDPDERDLYEQYIGRLKIYASIARVRPLTNAEQAAVDEIAQDVGARTEALVREDAMAVADRNQRVRDVERDIVEGDLAERSAADLLAHEDIIAIQTMDKLDMEEAEIKSGIAAVKATTDNHVQVLNRRIEVLTELHANLETERQSIENEHGVLERVVQRSEAEYAKLEARLAVPRSAKSRDRLMKDLHTAAKKVDDATGRLVANETEQKQRFPVIERLQQGLVDEVVELTDEAKVVPAKFEAVSRAAEEEFKLKEVHELAAVEANAAKARAILAEKPYAAALSKRESARDFTPNKRFASRDSDILMMQRSIAELMIEIKPELAESDELMPKLEAAEDEKDPEQSAKEEAKQVALEKYERYKIKSDDGRDELDRFIDLHKKTGANGAHHITYDDVGVKANKGIFGVNTLWREAYPNEEYPWHGKHIKTPQLAQVIASRPGNDPILKRLSRKIPPEFKVLVLEHYGWVAPELGSEASGDEA